MRHKYFYALLVLGFGLAACGEDSVAPPETQTDMGPSAPDFMQPEPDQGAEDMAVVDMPEPEPDMAPDMEADMTTACRTPIGENAPRKLVFSKPYNNDAMPANTVEVWNLNTDGTLESISASFEVGNRVSDGNIIFTPDAEVGFVRLTDGKLASFKFSANDVEVIQAMHDPGEYISNIWAPPLGDGSFIYASKVGFRDSNGGLFKIPVDCETGMLGQAELVAPSKLLYGLQFDTDKRAFVAATDFLDSETPNHIHEVVLEPIVERVQSGSAFTDNDAILAGFDITPDGTIALMGDTNLFGTHRVGVVSLQNPMSALQVIEIEDPESIVISPWGNAAVVASVFGDAIFVLDIGDDAETPVSVRGELSTTQPVLLPDAMATVRRGDLRGHVWVAENVGIRHIKFEENGDVTDLGLISTGEGTSAIPGALGVTP